MTDPETLILIADCTVVVLLIITALRQFWMSNKLRQVREDIEELKENRNLVITAISEPKVKILQKAKKPYDPWKP